MLLWNELISWLPPEKKVDFKTAGLGQGGDWAGTRHPTRKTIGRCGELASGLLDPGHGEVYVVLLFNLFPYIISQQMPNALLVTHPAHFTLLATVIERELTPV